jgi:putative sterol carrier protein
MTDATTQFFSELGQRGHEPLLERLNGTVRFDLNQGKRTDHFLVAVKQGDITVAKANEEADCVVRADRALFDGFASGATTIMTAFLRGELSVQGDPQLLVLVQRIFPGPPSSRALGISANRDWRQP